MTTPLIEVRGLKKSFPIVKGLLIRRTVGEVVATDNVSFDIHEREVLGFVGETGSGKSTIGRLLLGLIQADSGQIRISGTSITGLSEREMKPFRKDFQIVFQDPLASLNPRRTAAENIARPLLNFNMKRTDVNARVNELLKLVGLEPQHANRFPHEFSGGQCQRIGIARALALSPRFLFLDEPVSALDVSIQAQILNLLKELKEKLNLTYLFVAHDLKIVSYISDRIMVLYQGRIAETGPSRQIYSNPLHPYTQSLLASVLKIGTKPNVSSADEPVTPIVDTEDINAMLDAAEARSKGCAYAGTCPHRLSRCIAQVPETIEVEPRRFVACHLFGQTEADDIDITIN